MNSPAISTPTAPFRGAFGRRGCSGGATIDVQNPLAANLEGLELEVAVSVMNLALLTDGLVGIRRLVTVAVGLLVAIAVTMAVTMTVAIAAGL